jgi:methionyl-tRNA formyltransferase
MTKPLSIVFAGTPAFTLPCLDALAASSHHLSAIYTQPDRRAGRGQNMLASATKTWGLNHQVPVYQPLNFKSPDTLATFKALNADVLVVIAYGLILPPGLLALPRYGCINVHASLLPRWRGASPIQHAILYGDDDTGVSIMQMDHGMDTGPVFTQAHCLIHPTDTSATLHDRLAALSINPLLKTLSAIANGTAVAIPQATQTATHAPKINKTDAAVNWQQSAASIDQQIRAFNPWPIAYTKANEQILRIYQARIVHESTTTPPGTIVRLNKQGLFVSTGDNKTMLIERVQFAGGLAMSIADWLHAGRDTLREGMRLQ